MSSTGVLVLALAAFAALPAAGASAAAPTTKSPQSAPEQPASPAISDCYIRCASPAVIRALDPTLSATVMDVDGGPVTVTFEVGDRSGALLRSGQVLHSPDLASPARWQIAPGLPADGSYRWRARACDDTACGPYSGWFAFTVDTNATVPEPTVVPVDRKLYFEYDGSVRASGGVGVPGQLRLGAHGEKDLARYIWWLDGENPTTTAPKRLGGPAVITVTPKRDFLRTLSVYSLDVAGHLSPTRTYRFLVTAEEPQAGHWLLDEAGTDPVAIDEQGRNPGTSRGGVTRVAGRNAGAGNAAHFSAPSDITTNSAVLATDRNFSVTAWVRLTDTAVDHVAVAQRGTKTSNFELGYRADAENVCFSVSAADTPGASTARACATSPYKAGEWVHLAGVYDPWEKQIRLYVDGGSNLAGETVVAGLSTNWKSTGPLAIGNGWSGSHWAGDIDDVTVYQRVLSEVEIEMQALDS